MSTVQIDAYWETQQDMVEVVHDLAYRDYDAAVGLFDDLTANGLMGCDMHENTYNTIRDILVEAERFHQETWHEYLKDHYVFNPQD